MGIGDSDPPPPGCVIVNGDVAAETRGFAVVTRCDVFLKAADDLAIRSARRAFVKAAMGGLSQAFSNTVGGYLRKNPAMTGALYGAMPDVVKGVGQIGGGLGLMGMHDLITNGGSNFATLFGPDAKKPVATQPLALQPPAQPPAPQPQTPHRAFGPSVEPASPGAFDDQGRLNPGYYRRYDGIVVQMPPTGWGWW